MHNREVEFFPASFCVSWLSFGGPDGWFSHIAVPGTNIHVFFLLPILLPLNRNNIFCSITNFILPTEDGWQVSSINKSVLFLLANIAPYLGKCFNLSKSETDAKISGQEPLGDCFGQTGLCFPQKHQLQNCEQCQFYLKTTSSISNMDHKKSLSLSTHPKT